MIPYVVEPGASLPLESYSPAVFGASFQRWLSPETPAQRYLAFFYLSDIWALDRDIYARRLAAANKPFILDRVADLCGDDLRTDKCSIVFDLSAEGHPFYRKAFDDLHSWLSQIKVHPRRVAIMSQNRALSRAYSGAYGQDAGVRFLTYDQFISGIAARLKSDGDTFRQHFHFDKAAYLQSDAAPKTKTFLCLNATPRPIRICVLSALEERGLLEDSLWSLLNEASGKGQFKLRDAESLMQQLQITSAIPYAAKLLAGGPKLLDEILVPNANMLIWNIPSESYRKTLVSIVTETDFSDGENVRITEKLVKSLVMGHPSVVFGNPGSMALARRFGFRSFEPLFDESYDAILDPATRFRTVIEQLDAIHREVSASNSSFLNKLKEIGRYNMRHAFDGQFHNDYVDVVERPLVSDMLELVA